MTSSPFHDGERAIQARAGVRELAERVGRSIRPTIPPLARTFLEERRWIVVGTLDDRGRPWASLLSGAPGFASAIDAQSVRVEADPGRGDPLEGHLQLGARAAVLAIDLATRRRLRLNGRITAAASRGIAITADQVYSNCPRYIQRRDETLRGDPDLPTPARRSAALSERQRAWIRATDTFFLVTANPADGVDASHRGGMPGFVRVEDQRLLWPDYDGNAMFNTLGNIHAYPHAGVLVPDFETGAALLLTGRGAIDWTPAIVAGPAGGDRLVSLDVEEVIELTRVLPVRLELREYSPHNPR